MAVEHAEVARAPKQRLRVHPFRLVSFKFDEARKDLSKEISSLVQGRMDCGRLFEEVVSGHGIDSFQWENGPP